MLNRVNIATRLKRRSKVKKFYRLNHQITAGQLRVIGEDGKQTGIMTLSEALKKAQESNLDLVEIAPDAKPPVAKLIDFKKFRYLEEKKEKEARKHTKEIELKEVRFSPFIGKQDFKTQLDRIKKFLSEGDLVKISIVFTGRQMAHTEFGPKLLKKIMTALAGITEKEREEKFEGRRLVTTLRPVKSTKSTTSTESTKS